MPFINADDHLADFDAKGFDQIVVGAGAAGIFIACELGRRNQRVLLLETGHFEADDARQSLNEVEEIGKPLGNAAWTRKRIIGGTTTAWGGQSQPFPREEFSRRDWIEHSGWPIGYDDLHDHYAAANRFMGIDTLNYDSDLHSAFRNTPPAFDSSELYYHYSKWANEPNFFRRHRAELERDVTLLYNAELLRIDLGGDGKVSRIELGNFRGERRTIEVDGAVILATGGIESNRILLLNDHQRDGGLGAQGGWLGRAFMEHPCLEGGVVETKDMHRLQAAFGTRMYKGSRYSGRIGASGAWQARNRMLSATGGLMWLYAEGDVGPLTHLRAFVRRPQLSRLGKVLRNLGRLIPGLWALATQGLVYKPGVTATLVFSLEQEPSRESYIALSDRRDRFGRRLAQLNWQIGDRTWETLIAYAETMKREFARANLGDVRLFDHIRLDAPGWRDYLTDVNHHMGGARMSISSAEGVVDRNLKVWDVDGLYVCSAAVFPTGFHSNPTLTVLALGSRLAEHLAGDGAAARRNRDG